MDADHDSSFLHLLCEFIYHLLIILPISTSQPTPDHVRKGDRFEIVDLGNIVESSGKEGFRSSEPTEIDSGVKKRE